MNEWMNNIQKMLIKKIFIMNSSVPWSSNSRAITTFIGLRDQWGCSYWNSQAYVNNAAHRNNLYRRDKASQGCLILLLLNFLFGFALATHLLKKKDKGCHQYFSSGSISWGKDKGRKESGGTNGRKLTKLSNYP